MCNTETLSDTACFQDHMQDILEIQPCLEYNTRSSAKRQPLSECVGHASNSKMCQKSKSSSTLATRYSQLHQDTATYIFESPSRTSYISIVDPSRRAERTSWLVGLQEGGEAVPSSFQETVESISASFRAGLNTLELSYGSKERISAGPASCSPMSLGRCIIVIWLEG